MLSIACAAHCNAVVVTVGRMEPHVNFRMVAGSTSRPRASCTQCSTARRAPRQ